MKTICKKCPKNVDSRGLCSTHYSQARRSGALDEHPVRPSNDKPKHTLSELNKEEQTATCAICGPVSVYYRKSRDQYICVLKKKLRPPSPYNYSYKFKAEVPGLSKEDVSVERQRLFLEQGGKCAICLREGSITYGDKSDKKKLCLDHCHETGKLRGLLCIRCNTTVGHLSDDPEAFKRGARYLEN